MINQCSIYLQVVTLLDITSINGTHIHNNYSNGIRGIRGIMIEWWRTYHWPNMDPLPTTCWWLWKRFIDKWFSTTCYLHMPLGNRYLWWETSQEWEYIISDEGQHHWWSSWWRTTPLMVQQRARNVGMYWLNRLQLTYPKVQEHINPYMLLLPLETNGPKFAADKSQQLCR